MNKQALFWGGIILFLIGVAGGIFFLIPGIPHLIADPHMHIKHAAAAFVVGVLGILASIVNRPKAQAQV
ncbi:MAG: hypothetical protein J2P37_36785 [Ktedonobacteraceae bacterium]|nr:hypothetical protein [Ktedonobacteraceae bacterium]